MESASGPSGGITQRKLRLGGLHRGCGVCLSVWGGSCCPLTSPPGVERSKEAAAGGAAARLLVLASHQRCNLFSSLRCLRGSNSSGSNTNFNLEWEWSWRVFFSSSLSSFRVGNLRLCKRGGKKTVLRARKKDSAPVNSGRRPVDPWRVGGGGWGGVGLCDIATLYITSLHGRQVTCFYKFIFFYVFVIFTMQTFKFT